MTQKPRKYSTEFKIKAVELSRLKGSQRLVAKELDVCAKNISRWNKEYEEGRLDGSAPSAAPKTSIELENIALRKALLDAELERDILKKAVAIFSKKDR
jgi:transposase